MLIEDVWLLWFLISGIAAIGLWWAFCAAMKYLLDRATVVHPRKTGATR